MRQHNWKELTKFLFSDSIGSSASVVIEDVIDNLEINNQVLNESNYSDFIMQLSHVLPRYIIHNYTIRY